MEIKSDISLTCRRCGNQFVFSKSEQEFYAQKGYNAPSHCKECRARKREQTPLFCSSCGTKLGDGTTGYCVACLAATNLEFQLEIRKIKASLFEAEKNLNTKELEKAQSVEKFQVKLNNAEAEIERVSELLENEKQINAELRKKYDDIQVDLEKSLKNSATLEWLKTAFNYIKDRLDTFERNQRNLNQMLIRFTQEVDIPKLKQSL